MCICVRYRHMGMRVPQAVHVGGGQMNVDVLLYHCLPYSSEMGSPDEPGASLAVSKSQ